MGAGIAPERLRRMKYRALKRIQNKLLRQDLELRYHDLELKGPNCRIYFAGCGPASNGESVHWLVLRFNPTNEPSAAKKQPGDVDYTDWWKRQIPGSEGTFDAGIRALLQLPR